MPDRTWSGVLAVEAQPTGDRRIFEAGALTWPEMPLPFLWQRSSEDGHGGAVIIGRVDSMERAGDDIVGTGVLFDSVIPEAAEYAALVDLGAAGGVSVDLDDAEVDQTVTEDADGFVEVTETRFLTARIRAVTAVSVPAFVEARITLDSFLDAPDEEGDLDAPIVEEDVDVEAPTEEASLASEAAVEETAGGGPGMVALLPSEADAEILAVADGLPAAELHLTLSYLGPDVAALDGEDLDRLRSALAQGAAGLAPIEATVAGFGVLGSEDPPANVLLVNGEGIAEIQALVSGEASTMAGVPAQHVPFIAHTTLGYGIDAVPTDYVGSTITYDRIALALGDDFEIFALGDPAPAEAEPEETPVEEEEEEAVVASASLVAAAPRAGAPDDWFQYPPEVDGPTPLTVTSDGRVFGHLALFDSCHIGIQDACIRPPRSATDYAYFHTGRVTLASGATMAVGRITFDTGHAGRSLRAGPAAEHYDNTGHVGADVRAYEDEWGILLAGATREGLSDEQVRTFAAAPTSGDWRQVGASLELVAALSVNVPGFPITRALIAGGETVSLLHGTTPEAIAAEAARPMIPDHVADLARDLLAARVDAPAIAAKLKLEQRMSSATVPSQ